jgi:hypothetical protein
MEAGTWIWEYGGISVGLLSLGFVLVGMANDRELWFGWARTV